MLGLNAPKLETQKTARTRNGGTQKPGLLSAELAVCNGQIRFTVLRLLKTC